MTDSVGSSRVPLMRPVRRDSKDEKPSSEDMSAEARKPQVRVAGSLPASTTVIDDAGTVLGVMAESQAESLAKPLNFFSRFRFLRWALILAIVLFVLTVALDLFDLVSRLASVHWSVAGFVLAIVGVFALFLVAGGVREYRQLRTLRNLKSLNEEGERLLLSEAYGGSSGYIQSIKALYTNRGDLVSALARFEQQQDQPRSDADQVKYLSAELGAELDRQAQQIVARYVRQLAVISALNPVALLDSLVVLWLSIKMVREIAVVYGGQPGLLSSWRLAKEVAVLVAAAGAADFVGDTATDMLGASLTSILSAKLAQGVVTGLLVARVGLISMKLCRPIPLAEQEKQLWSSLRKEVFSLFPKDD